ncbi:MAG: zinc ribbon domain-containing protein [Bacilli bacterium]|nr:zinc ribbon domain-containing protein [Bacilli bacterium]
MKKYSRYLEWIPFAICLGALLIYIVYTIQIKTNPAIIVTDQLVSTLKTYLIIALVSLFIGLLIILIKKIRKLSRPTVKSYVRHTIREENVVEQPRVVVEEPRVVVEEPKVVEQPKVVVEETKIVTEPKVEEKVVMAEPIIEEKIVHENKKQYIYKLEGVVCPECGNSISSKAAICPHCGILFDEEIIKVIKKYEKGKTKVRRKNSLMVTLANILLIILFIFLIFLIWNPIKARIDNYRQTYEIIQRQ